MTAPRIFVLRPPAAAGERKTPVQRVFDALKRNRDEGRAGESLQDLQMLLDLPRVTVVEAIRRFKKSACVESVRRGVYRLKPGIETMPQDRRGRVVSQIAKRINGLGRWRASLVPK